MGGLGGGRCYGSGRFVDGFAAGYFAGRGEGSCCC